MVEKLKRLKSFVLSHCLFMSLLLHFCWGNVTTRLFIHLLSWSMNNTHWMKAIVTKGGRNDLTGVYLQPLWSALWAELKRRRGTWEGAVMSDTWLLETSVWFAGQILSSFVLCLKENNYSKKFLVQLNSWSVMIWRLKELWRWTEQRGSRFHNDQHYRGTHNKHIFFN